MRVSLLLALVLACGSAEPNGLGNSSAEIVSDEFLVACETGSSPAVAVHQGTALAAWQTGNRAHAARFDSSGVVLDMSPIDVGVPPAWVNDDPGGCQDAVAVIEVATATPPST